MKHTLSRPEVHRFLNFCEWEGVGGRKRRAARPECPGPSYRVAMMLDVDMAPLAFEFRVGQPPSLARSTKIRRLLNPAEVLVQPVEHRFHELRVLFRHVVRSIQHHVQFVRIRRAQHSE